MDKKKKIIGILGAVGSGKSSVAKVFADLGCAVIDADLIAHGFLRDSTVKEQVKNAFGEIVFGNDGQIDRDKLSLVVFESQTNVARINEIIHPLVLADCQRQIDDLNTNSQAKAIVLDMPLLAEVGWAQKCDILVFVECDEETRTLRAAEKGEYYKKKLKKRENFQISLDKKLKLAHYTVDNNSSLPAIAEQVMRFFSIIITS